MMEHCYRLSVFVYALVLVAGAAQSAADEQARPRPGPAAAKNNVSTGQADSDDDDEEPQQIHISLAGKNAVRIAWATESHTAQPVVSYGASPGKYTQTVTGNSSYYRAFVIYRSPQLHEAVLPGLDPGTAYYYKLGNGQSGEKRSFSTPPATLPLVFAVVGDPGQTDWTEKVLQAMASSPYHVMLLPGDLSYADNYHPLWDKFGNLVQDQASSRPWMVTEGNHEIEHVPLLSKPFKAYNARWHMPYEESGSTSNLFYSFETAGAHILMLGSYADFDSESDQYQWLVKDLNSVDRAKTPWLIALIHAPWYNTNEDHQGEGEDMRLAMEDLLFKSAVDLVLAGHVHAYERFTRVYDNSENECGPVHITVGDGGNREGLATNFMQINEGPGQISLFREASYGHAQLILHNKSHAQWFWNRVPSNNTAPADTVWLQNLSLNSKCLSG